MLSSVKRATLITLVRLWKLFLRGHVKIALGDGKLFHVALGINILNALVDIVDGSSVLLILGCRQILEFSKCMLLIDDCVTYKILGWRG